MSLFIKDKNFYKTVLLLALPVALQNTISIGVNLVDTIMLGAFGEAQLSASSLATNFYSLFTILCMGIGGGGTVMTAQFWGKKDLFSFKRVVTIIYRITIIASLLFMGVSMIFGRQIMGIYASEPDIIESGVKYFSFLSYTYLFMGLSQVTTLILRSYGCVKIPLISSIISFFVNIFSNWIFIFGKFGFPCMEITGAALGTLISRIVEFIIIVGYFLCIDQKIRYRLSDLFLNCKAFYKDYLHYSMPVVTSDSLLAIGNNMVAIIIGRLGKLFVTANSICGITVQLTTVFAQGISSASATITGNTIGEGDLDKAYEQGVTLVALSGIVGIVASLIVYTINPFILSFYNVTIQTKEIANQLLAAVAFCTIFTCLQSVLTKGVLRAGGDTHFLMIADILFLWVASVPLGILSAWILKLSPFYIYLSLRIDVIIKSFWCLGRLKSRKWMKQI